MHGERDKNMRKKCKYVRIFATDIPPPLAEGTNSVKDRMRGFLPNESSNNADADRNNNHNSGRDNCINHNDSGSNANLNLKKRAYICLLKEVMRRVP